MIKKKIALFTLLPNVSIAKEKVYLPLLLAAAFLLNLVFLFFYNPEIYYTMTQLHGQLGYNFYRTNTLTLNPAITSAVQDLQQEHDRLVDFDQFRDQQWPRSNEVFPVHDPIGYGVLLGLLWKLTGSLKFRDVQVLQIMLFIIALCMLYHSIFLLYGSLGFAVLASSLLLCFLPIVVMNIQPARDIWSFYAMVVLWYLTIKMWQSTATTSFVLLAGIFFAWCQWMRPTLVTALMVFTVLNIIYGCVHRDKIKAIVRTFCLLWCMNILFFWLPFALYNQYAYQRYFVSPCGQNLLEGLGEFENPWGYQLSDPWIADYIFKKYGYAHGTAAFDDAAKKEFWQAVGQQPFFYIKTLIKRLPQVFLPPLQWLMLKQSPYINYATRQDKIKALLRSPSLWLDFVLRWLYIKLFLLLGYIGFYYMLRDKRFWELLLLGAVIVCGWATFPSHIECRYLVPFYWPFALGVAYFIYYYLSIRSNTLTRCADRVPIQSRY